MRLANGWKKQWNFTGNLKCKSERNNLRDFIAGMGRAELIHWLLRDGWIPPELEPLFKPLRLRLVNESHRWAHVRKAVPRSPIGLDLEAEALANARKQSALARREYCPEWSGGPKR